MRAPSFASCRALRCMRSLIPDAVATQTISAVEAIDFAYAKELELHRFARCRARSLMAGWCMRALRRCWCRWPRRLRGRTARRTWW